MVNLGRTRQDSAGLGRPRQASAGLGRTRQYSEELRKVWFNSQDSAGLAGHALINEQFV
jgi:hypothetical protein